MAEEFIVDTKFGTMIVSADVVNDISESLLAQIDTQDELDYLLRGIAEKQYARKTALRRAYEEVPVPAGSFSMAVRQELQQKRNELVEKYYQEILNK